MNQLALETKQQQSAIDKKEAPTPNELFQLSSSTLCHNHVYNHKDEKLGKVQEFVIALPRGGVLYAIMSSGGFLGVGEKLLAIPWQALTLDRERKCFVLPLSLERLQRAPSFEHNDWPDMSDPVWRQELNRYFGTGHSEQPN